MKHVFISYVREDQAQVDNLVKDLSSNGVDVWLDRERIRAGERWRDAIRKAIQEGAFFIACFSDAYYKRDKATMHEELAIALD